MRTQRPTQAWILICLVTVVSSGTSEHAPPHHVVSQHGEHTPQKRPQDTIAPFGIQIPEHVLTTQNVACISADDNIFQIINEAQKTCKGSDMRCTFYHFVNHGYENIGTLDVNKELFDDLLMKFDNWLLTAENIDKTNVHGNTKGGNSVDTAGIYVNDRYKNEGKVASSSNTSKVNGLDTIQGTVDHKSDDTTHSHHIKNPDETHHKNHHKWKNGNHIKLDAEYNNGHRYFEVFLPKDKETGKPRTIYVEIDRDKNEFVLLDEDIDKKLNGVKPIKIELDELSEIADTAFGDLVKSSKHKGHMYNNLDEDDRVMTSDLNTTTAVGDHEIPLGTDADELTQNILNLSVCNPNICNINANQQLVSNNTTGYVKKVINVNKNLVVPNKYINQAQFHVESHINNTTDMMPNHNFEILQNINETEKHDFDEKELFNTIEFDHSNITEIEINNVDNSSLEFKEIPCENEYSNFSENNEFSIDHENITYDDNDFIQLVENNDTNNDNINVDDTQNFASPNAVHLKDKENKLTSTPDIYVKPESTSTLTAGMSSDHIGSQLHLIPFENRERHTDLDTHSLVSSKPISPYTTVPILGKDLAKVVETDTNLQSSFPVYTTLDLLASDSQNSPGHSTQTSDDYSPVEFTVGHNKGSEYSFLPTPPLNFGVRWPPSYSPTEELQTPCAAKSLLFENTFSPQDSILPITQPSKEFSGRPEYTSLDHTLSDEDPKLFQKAPSLSFGVQKPCLTTSPFNLESITPSSPRHELPTKIDFPSTTPLSVIPYSPNNAINSPYPFQPLPPSLQPTKENLGFVSSPFDNNFKDTMIPCLGNGNTYPCNTFPYFFNPHLKPPQLIPPYLDPQLPVTPLQPISKFPTFDSPSTYLDQSYPCLNTDYPRETKPMPFFPFAPNTPISPLNPPRLGSGFIPNTCSNLWNNNPYQNMPYSPYSVLPAQNRWKYPPNFNNYLAPPMELQQSQLLKPLPTKETSKSILENSYPTKNILQMTPLTYAPVSSVYPRPVQMDLNPSFSLERDLQTLSCKYGIPLSKILDSLEAEMFDSHSKTCSSPFELPCSTLEHGNSMKTKSTSSATTAAVNDENRSGNEEIKLESDLTNLTPLDSSLIGPHLDMDNALILDSNYQTYTVASETTEPLNAHLSLKNQPKQVFQDSSLIGPQLSTLSTSNFQLIDEDRSGNVELHLESDSSSLMPLDSSLIGPHLEKRPSVVLDSSISPGSIVTPHAEVPGSSSPQIKTKHNTQNQPAKFSLDSSLKGPHLSTSSKAKPLLNGEIQSINDLIPLESDLTELTPLDSSQIDPINEQSETLQHDKSAVTLSAVTDNTNLFKSGETKPHVIEGDLFPLDSSLIGPHLQTGSSSIHTGSVEQETVPEITEYSLQNDNELESIILPPSMLPTLLQKTLIADLNLNNHTQVTQLSEEHNERSLETNVDLPITDITSITSSLKESDFKILETTLVHPKIEKNKLTAPGIIHTVDSDTQLDGSFFSIPLHKIETQEMSSNLDSSIQLDNSLIGPSILHEIDSREMSPILDAVDLKSSIGAKFANQNKKSLTISAAIDSEIEPDSSLTGPALYKEIKSHGSSTSSNFGTQLDNSLIVPNLHETIGSPATETNSQLQSSTKGHGLIPETDTIDDSPAFISKNILDSSLVGPHLSTASFSTDEIKMINKELHLQSDLVHLKPLDASLIGPHLYFESQLDESEISRYHNPELSDSVEEKSLLQQNTKPSVYPSELQELLSKFTNAITKSHLSPSEMKPCDKLLSSIAKISSDSKNIPCEDLQTYSQLFSQDEIASEFSPRPLMVLEQNFLPVESIAKGQPSINSNYFETPVTLPQYAYAKEVPQIPFMPYSPFVQMKPLIHHNWQGPPLNIQNILQGSPGLPVAENAPIPFISNELGPLSPEDYKLLLDLASQSNMNPQLLNPNMLTPRPAIAPSSEWITSSQILPSDKNISFLPKKSPVVLPSYSESTVCNTEYNPVVIDDIISLINENSHQILKDIPYSQSIVPPTISKPHPLTNAMIPSPFYNPHIGMYSPQKIQAPYSPPYNLQAYPNIPEEALFSEMIGPAPKILSLPIQSPNTFVEPQLYDISNIPQFIESLANPLLEKEYLQQLLSKACLDSPIVLPSSALDAILQLPTASNELTELSKDPCQSPPAYQPAISAIYSTPLSNAFTSPLLPSYASPLSIPYAKAILTPSTILPIDLPFAATPITSPTLSSNPYTTSPFTPEFSSPFMPIKTESSDYTYLPTVTHNRPIPSVVPYKPCHTYSSPYLPVQPIPMPLDSSPYSPFINKLTPAMSSLYSPLCSQSLSAPYLRPATKSLTNFGLPAYSEPVSASPISPTQTDILSPSYLVPDPSFSYTPLPDTSTQKRPSSLLSSAYLIPKSLGPPMNTRYIPSNPMFSPIPKITNQELQFLRPMSTFPGPYENNLFSNANQMVPIRPNYSIPSYSIHVPKLSPYSNSQIKQNVPCGDVIQSNLQTYPLTEEEPFYNVREDNMYTHSDDREKYYHDSILNYPSESMSYTLAPEEMTETLRDEDLIIPEGFVTSALVNSHASEHLSPAKVSQRPAQTPYASLYGKPCSTQHFSPPTSLNEFNQQNIFDNISLMPPSNPLKFLASQPISILSSPLLKPLTPFTAALNLPMLPYPCMDTSRNPNYMLPLNKEPLFSSPYYSTTGQNIAKPMDPRALKDITSPAFFQVPMNIPFTPVSPTTLSQPPTSPIIPNNLILISPPNDPQSFAKSSSIPNYKQYAAPIMSQFPGLEESIIPRYITPLSPAHNVKKIKPLFSPQYMSPILPAATTFQDNIPLYETPIHYKPVIAPPTGLVTSPYSVLPSFNNVIEPLSTDFNKAKWSSFTPKYSLPETLSLPIPVSSTTVPLSTFFPATSPKTTKQALTNHIIPSSLYTIPDTDLLTTTSSKKLSPLHMIPKYNLPSPTFGEPLEIVPCETLTRPLGNSVLPQNILKPNGQFSSGQFTVPLSSSAYLTQLLPPIVSYPAQPKNIQFTTKPHAKLSPVSTQCMTPPLTPSFTNLPFKTVPNRLINKAQYGLPSVPIYDTPMHTSSSGRNPFLNPNFKPIPEVPSFPVPNNHFSSPKMTPFDSILLSNLRPVDISENPFEPYSQITSLPPLHSSSLLQPLPQKSRLFQPEIIPINSQYVSLNEGIPQLLPSTSPILNSPLLKPLLTDSQNIAPFIPMHLSRLNTVSPKTNPTNYLPSVTGTYQYPGLPNSLLSEIPETVEPINLMPSTPFSLFKSRFKKPLQTPVTMRNMPLYSNYDIVEPLPELSMKANIVNIAKPTETSAFSALDSSLPSRDSFDPEIIEEIEPAPDSKYRLPALPMNLNQQRQFYPFYTTIPKSSSKYKISKPRPSFSAPSLIPEDVELIDTADFVPLSQIKSEPLIAEYSPTDRQAPILKNTPSTPDISQFFPYTTLLNTEASSPISLKLTPKLQGPGNSNQLLRLTPLFLTPEEYRDLVQGPSISERSSSSPSSNFLTSSNFGPHLVSSQLTGKPPPGTLYTSTISNKPESWLQSPLLEQSLPPHEIPVKVTPEKENIQTLLNKYRPYNKIAPHGVNRYLNELISSIPEVHIEQDIVKPRFQSGPSAEYQDNYSNDFIEYDSENMPYDNELENISVEENRLGSIETKSFTETLPEIVKGLNIPSYNEMTQRPQRLSKLDNFYANNHIGQSPEVLTVPAYKTLPADVKSHPTTISPEILKEFDYIATKHFGAIPKLDTTSQMRPHDYYENENSPKNVPITNTHPQTYLNPYSKHYSESGFPPNSIEIADTFEMLYQPTSYAPNNNIDDIKYSGYKTYQIPSLKSPKSTQNLGILTKINDPTMVTYTPPILANKPSELQQNPSNSYFNTPTEIYELPITQSQTLVDMTTRLQTKLGLDTLQESPELNEYSPLISQHQTPEYMTIPLQSELELNALKESPEYDEYNPIEDIPVSVDNINEDKEFKSSLIRYINTRGDVKNNLNNNDGELTIPIGNIAITKKEPYNADTIETNNPSIGLKVWKSNVKIAQAELKLKFKDLSVNNFMPVINNIDKYDMEEIRKIVKNYIDEKFGAHIEVNEPYTIDNKYSFIKDFDHNAVENKYNLLWPAHYV